MALNQKKKNISFVPVNTTSLGQKYCFTTATTASLMEIYSHPSASAVSESADSGYAVI